jgi:predicted Zn-dependent peptidase
VLTHHPHRAFDEWRDQSGHQAHTIMGARLFGRTDPRRFPLMLLNNYLAGPCMNSRLNQELREKRGYVYTVDSSFALMSNCGVMFIYFGSDEAHVAKCRTLIERELDQLAQSPIKPVIFDRIKRQYIGQLKVSSDNRESFAMSLGKSLLYFNEVHDIERTTKELEAVTAEDVRAVAELLTSDKYSCLTLL